MKSQNYKICSSCIMDTSDPNIVFDERGECDYCNNFKNNILPNWNFGVVNGDGLKNLAAEIKEDAKGNDFDCIIGLSGGLDSSYAAYIAKRKDGASPVIIPC